MKHCSQEMVPLPIERSIRIHVIGAAASQEQILIPLFWSELSSLIPERSIDILAFGPDLDMSQTGGDPFIKISERCAGVLIKDNYINFVKQALDGGHDIDADLVVAFNAGFHADSEEWSEVLVCTLCLFFPLKHFFVIKREYFLFFQSP